MGSDAHAGVEIRASGRRKQAIPSPATTRPARRCVSLSPILTSDPPPSMKPDSHPNTAEQWRAEGDACIARGDVEAALRCFESACTLEPADPRAAASVSASNRSGKRANSPSDSASL
ncbi:hypothetical protein F6X42_23025 [Paraburkholderia sp. WC7.3b]|uniref:Tetratricopeptide repeat protein n=1 Tax=Paraburkholderia podalyriae TaxID=1938811 RepID=A0ABR7PSV1_9BURK|nr:hypothetical protein [Paraburkholderia podalyriae]